MRFAALVLSLLVASPALSQCPGGNCGGGYRASYQQVPGPLWDVHGDSVENHLRSVHGIDPTGMSYQQMVAAHSDAHNRMQGRGRTVVNQSRPAVRRGLFRRWRR
jgi:hypothetical protein